MRLIIAHDGDGNITAVTASSNEAPPVYMELQPGQHITEIDAPEITSDLAPQQVHQRLADLAQKYRVEAPSVKGRLVEKI